MNLPRLTTETTSWGLNMVFPVSWVRPQPDGEAPVAYGLFDDWLAIQKHTATTRP